jgi:hypothetical protein
MTHRQYATWAAWQDAQWNEPGREDHYLMQIAAEVRRGRAKNPRQVKDKDLKISFVKIARGEEPGKMSKEKATALAKARSLARVGASKRPMPVMEVLQETPRSLVGLEDPESMNGR